MIVVRNQQELNEKRNQILNGIIESVEHDIETIESCYSEQSEEYGPLVVVINETEKDDLEMRFPIINKVESEDIELVYKDAKTLVFRILYVVADAGIVVYSIKEN